MHAATATGPRRQCCCASPVRSPLASTHHPAPPPTHSPHPTSSFFFFFPSPCLSRCASLSFFIFLCPVLSSCSCCGGQSPSPPLPLRALWRRADSTHGDHAETRPATRNQYDHSGRRAGRGLHGRSRRLLFFASLCFLFSFFLSFILFSLFLFCPSLPPFFSCVRLQCLDLFVCQP